MNWNLEIVVNQHDRIWVIILGCHDEHKILLKSLSERAMSDAREIKKERIS